MNEIIKGLFRKEGEPQFCHDVGRMLVPTKIVGQIGITEKECGAWCPLFDYYPQTKQLNILCGCEKVVYKIEKHSSAEPSNVHRVDFRPSA